MHFDSYQTLADDTAVYPGKGSQDGLIYAVLGLTNEAGEVAGKLKKFLRGDTDFFNGFDDFKREALSDELGDVLWYLSAVATNLGISLDAIADNNLRKLQSRKERGVLKGSGDNR